METPNLLVKPNLPSSNEYNNIKNNINGNSNDLLNSLDERLSLLRKTDDDDDDDIDADDDGEAVLPFSKPNNDNTFSTNHQILDKLKEDIKIDENIAMKSALLLKLLEVSVDL